MSDIATTDVVADTDIRDSAFGSTSYLLATFTTEKSRGEGALHVRVVAENFNRHVFSFHDIS